MDWRLTLITDRSPDDDGSTSAEGRHQLEGIDPQQINHKRWLLQQHVAIHTSLGDCYYDGFL